MDKKIVDPYWGDEGKSQVVCTFEYEDGSSLTASVMNTDKGEDNNPDWDQIFKEHSIRGEWFEFKNIQNIINYIKKINEIKITYEFN